MQILKLAFLTVYVKRSHATHPTFPIQQILLKR